MIIYSLFSVASIAFSVALLQPLAVIFPDPLLAFFGDGEEPVEDQISGDVDALGEGQAQSDGQRLCLEVAVNVDV